MANRNIWIAGATGLVGKAALDALLGDATSEARVLAVVRRATGRTHVRLGEAVVDFERVEAALAGGRADAAICCLGTTIKQAGSQAQFRHIDLDYVLAFARAACAAGAAHFLVVTALGADARSRVFYNRVKGEVEEALSVMPFRALTVVRPSLLIGERAERRIGERLAAPIARLLPRSVRGIEAEKVGRALARLALAPAQGKRVVLSGELHDLGA